MSAKSARVVSFDEPCTSRRWPARVRSRASAILRGFWALPKGSSPDSSFESDPARPEESAQEFVETHILGCFLKNDEFGLCDRHALGLEQQVAQILVAAAPSKKGFDVAVDGFHYSEAYFGAAVVEDAVPVIQQYVSEGLKSSQPLPSQFIDPALQVAKHRSFIAVGPQSLQAFL